MPSDSSLLVSRYLNHPYLIDGHKFDLRIYVAVTSFYPLVTYVFYDGLTRFEYLINDKKTTLSNFRLASAKYDPSSSHRDEFVHLTNYSINKNNKQFIRLEILLLFLSYLLSGMKVWLQKILDTNGLWGLFCDTWRGKEKIRNVRIFSHTI